LIGSTKSASLEVAPLKRIPVILKHSLHPLYRQTHAHLETFTWSGAAASFALREAFLSDLFEKQTSPALLIVSKYC
jgi:hypothetical protein